MDLIGAVEPGRELVCWPGGPGAIVIVLIIGTLMRRNLWSLGHFNHMNTEVRQNSPFLHRNVEV